MVTFRFGLPLAAFFAFQVTLVHPVIGCPLRCLVVFKRSGHNRLGASLQGPFFSRLRVLAKIYYCISLYFQNDLLCHVLMEFFARSSTLRQFGSVYECIENFFADMYIFIHLSLSIFSTNLKI